MTAGFILEPFSYNTLNDPSREKYREMFMTKTSISTIIFDLSEVLITGLLDIEKRLARHLGISPDGLFPAFGGQPLTDLFRGRITEEAYLTQLVEKQQWRVPITEFKSLIRQNFHQRIPGMEQVVSSLATQYELVLLSDHAREWLDYIKLIHPFLSAFNYQYFSFQLGQTKSDTTTFEKVLTLMQKRPDQCIFIDDLPNNIASAEKAGILSIQFTNAVDLILRLADIGIYIEIPGN